MKMYNSKKQPYRQMLIDLNETIDYVDGTIVLSYTFMYYTAKATGLKSKKHRHIKKRFKRVLNQALTKTMRDYERLSDK